jgi:Ni,Fe-hydrogenase III small subunit
MDHLPQPELRWPIRRALVGPHYSLSADEVAAQIGLVLRDGERQQAHIRRVLVRPRVVQVRHFDAGSCGLCEIPLSFAVLFPRLASEQFGITLCASPLEADTLAVIGPLTVATLQPLLDTIVQTPDCRIVLVGDCASGRPRCCDRHLSVLREIHLREVLARSSPQDGRRIGKLAHEVEMLRCPNHDGKSDDAIAGLEARIGGIEAYVEKTNGIAARIAARVYGRPPDPRVVLLALALLDAPEADARALTDRDGIIRSPLGEKLLALPGLIE